MPQRTHSKGRQLRLPSAISSMLHLRIEPEAVEQHDMRDSTIAIHDERLAPVNPVRAKEDSERLRKSDRSPRFSRSGFENPDRIPIASLLNRKANHSTVRAEDGQ